jgi:hypothetical protein
MYEVLSKHERITLTRHFGRRTAICRGAVFKGFLEEHDNQLGAPIMVTSTVSRASYGVKFQTDFDPLIHPLEDREWDKHEGVWKATNRMNWYLERVRATPNTP